MVNMGTIRQVLAMTESSVRWGATERTACVTCVTKVAVMYRSLALAIAPMGPSLVICAMVDLFVRAGVQVQPIALRAYLPVHQLFTLQHQPEFHLLLPPPRPL